jgi:hypothetical protein
MKRVKRIKIWSAAGLLALFAMLQLLCALRAQSMERSLPHAAALINPSGVGITMLQAQSTQEKPSSGNQPNIIIGALSNEELRTVRVTGFGASVKAYTAYATPLAGLCLPLRYTYGNWFLPDESGMASLAVIPQSLSLVLFGTDKPAGNSLSIDRTDYRICGVYSEYGVFAQENGFLQKISGDGIPRIYLYSPLRMAQLPVTVLYLSDENQSEAQLLKQQASDAYKTLLNGKIVDYRQQIRLANSLWYLSVLLCVFLPAAMLLVFAGLQFVRLHARQNESVSQKLKHFLLGTCFAAIVLILLTLMLNRFRIPQSYLTQENIFAFSAYVKSIESFFTSLHAESRTSHFEWTFVTQLLGLLFWALISLGCFCAGILKVYRIVKQKYPAWVNGGSAHEP